MAFEFGGAVQGAVAGSTIGQAAGPWGALIGGGIGGIAGGLGALGKPRKVAVPDIGAELARIRALYDQAAATARAGITQRAGQERGLEASNLAARGVYTSPVSQNTFGLLRDNTQSALAASDAAFGVQSANAQSAALAALFNAQGKANEYNAGVMKEEDKATYAGLGALGQTLLKFGLDRKPKVPGAMAQAPGLTWGSPFASNTQNLIPSYGLRPSFAGWR